MAGGTGKAYASSQTQIALAIETTKGTPATTPKFWIPVKGPKYKPDQTVIPDETIQGTMVSVYDQVPGMRYDSHGWDSYPYLDSFGVLLRCEFGSSDTKTTAATATTLSTAVVAGATKIKTAATVAAGSWLTFGTGNTLETHRVKSVTGSYTLTLTTPVLYAHAAATTVTGLTTHAFSLLNNAGTGNQPPSATIWDYDGETTRQLSAGQLTELTIKGNDTGFVTYTCSWFANAAKSVTKVTASFTDTQAPPGWTFTGLIDSTQLNYIEDWEFDFKRGVKPIPALTGTQEYFEYFANTLQCTGKITVLEQSGSPQLADYLAGTILPFTFTFNDTRNGYACNFHSTKAAFKAGAIERSKEWVEVSLTFQLLPSSTDATAGGRSPVKVTLANGETTAY